MKCTYVLPDINLGSPIAQLIVELEPLRTRQLSGTTPPWLFFSVKQLFQTIESVISAHIEGNNTTIADYIDAARDAANKANVTENITMILNVEQGIKEIEAAQSTGIKITKQQILEWHRIVVNDLTPYPMGEGDDRPGGFRTAPRQITNSKHVLPAPADLNDLVDELITFINQDVPHQLELLKIALVHHRFVWVHPFGNGNGRVVRLLTYAMLANAGYIDKDGARLLDPTAVFGSDKREYYAKLAGADDMSEQGLTAWTEYMLKGFSEEIHKVDQLLQEDFIKQKIIIPAINYSYSKERLSTVERDILLICVDKNIISASDISHLFPADISRVNISHTIRNLRDQDLLEPTGPNARKYFLKLSKNAISSGIIKQLDEHGFLPPQNI